MFHGPSDAFLLMFGQQRSVSGSGRAQQSLVMRLPGAPTLSSVCVNVSAAGGQRVGHPLCRGPSLAFPEASSVSSTVTSPLSHLG